MASLIYLGRDALSSPPRFGIQDLGCTTPFLTAVSAWSMASCSSSSGSLESQSRVLSCRGALQPGAVQVRPVALKPTVSI